MLIDTLTVYRKPTQYRLYLCKPNKEIIAILDEAYNITLTINLVNLSELSFSIPYSINGKKNPNFDLIKGDYLIFLQQRLEEDDTVLLERYFVITNPNKQADDIEVLNVECKSLEYELTRKNLRSFKGVKKLYRTPSEIAGFVPNEMYPDLTSFIQSGILNVVISLCPSWSVGTVDIDLNSKFRDVQIDVKAVYDFLINDCGKMFDAIFEFDTINKTINVKKLNGIGINRGLFIDENYIKQLGENPDHTEIVTRLYLYGKDNLSINSINPAGTSYIENYSYYRNLNFMSQSLLDALDAYDALLETKKTEFSTLLSNLNTFTNQLAIKNDELDILESQLLVLEDTKDSLIKQGASLTTINAQITAKQSEITAKKAEITSVQNNIISTNNSILALRNLIAKENNFTSDQILELDSFIKERDFVDTSYIDVQELYDAGAELLSRINQPPIQFSISVVDFLNSVEDQHNWDRLRIGDIINIQYSKFNINVELRLISYTHNWENNDLQLTFSNKSRLNDPNMVLEELLQNTISTSTSLDINKFKYGRYEDSNERTALMNYITNELNLAAQKAKAGANQNIEIGRNGISCKDTTDSGEEIRILNNLIALTTDNWNTAKVAITPEGVNAEVVRGYLGEFCTVRANQIVVGDEGEQISDDLIESAPTWNQNVSSLNNFITVTYPNDKNNLQTQIDGKIETYYTATDPNTWTTADRAKHNGDMWYNTSTKQLKRYNSTTNTWELIEDQTAIQAFSNAAIAQDTADSKRRVFTTTPTPPYDIGDLWAQGSSGDLKRCINAKTAGQNYSASDWDLASKYTDDSVALGALLAASEAQNDALEALDLLDDISNDSKVTPSEKLEAKQKWDIIVAEGNPTTGTIIQQANSFGVSHIDFDADYNALNTYLNATLNIFGNMSATTNIVRSTWDTTWKNYYDERTKLLNAIAAKAKEVADNAETLAKTSNINLIKNGGFEISTGKDGQGLPDGWSKGEWNASGVYTFGRWVDGDWTISGHCTAVIFSNSGEPSASSASYYQDIYGLRAGATYTISGMLSAHRCTSSLEIFIFDSDNNTLHSFVAGTITDNYIPQNVSTTFTLPTNTARVRVEIRKSKTSPGQPDSYLFADNIKLEEGNIKTPFVETDLGSSDALNNSLQQGVL